MFTGLVDDVGTIERVADTAAGREFVIRCRYDDLADGESIAVNGACLTVREREAGRFTVAAVVTTLDRTAMHRWRAGSRVNLERALRVGDRLGGHMVQGHVDGVGVELPDDLAERMVPHGSIAIDGVSLTVNALPEPGTVELSLIEYTLRHTTLGDLAVGDPVHVEGDVIGKYVRRLIRPYANVDARAASLAHPSSEHP